MYSAGLPAYGPLFGTPLPVADTLSLLSAEGPRLGLHAPLATPPSAGVPAATPASAEPARGLQPSPPQPAPNEELVKAIDLRLLELGHKIERSLEKSMEEQQMRAQVQHAVQSAIVQQQQQQLRSGAQTLPTGAAALSPEAAGALSSRGPASGRTAGHCSLTGQGMQEKRSCVLSLSPRLQRLARSTRSWLPVAAPCHTTRCSSWL